MKRIFRWQGLVAFIALTAGLLLFFMLFADTLVKKSIEVSGTRLVGARVEVGAVDLSFIPAGLEIFNLQITNPDAPMTNAAEIDRLALSIYPGNLVRRKIDIHEMAMTGVRFNTARKTSGAVKTRRPEKKQIKDQPPRFQLPSFDMADVQAILKKEALESLEEIEHLKNEVDTRKASIGAKLAELPDSEKMTQYETRIKALQEKSGPAGIVGGIKEVADLQNEIKNDMNRIRKLRDEVKTSSRTLKTRSETLARSPQDDINRLKNKYALSPEGAGNMTGLLFGPRYQQWVETGLTWHSRLQPLITRARARAPGEVVAKPERGKGITVHFRDRTMTPDFLVRLADVSVATEAGNLSGTIKDITTEQPVLGRPLIYRLSSEQMKDLDSLNIDGQLDHVVPDQSRDTLNINAQGIRISKFQISGSDDFPLVLNEGMADCRIASSITGDRIHSEAKFNIRGTRFSLERGSGLNQIEQAVASALADVSQLSLTVTIEGALNDYKVRISSDLDDVIKKTVSRVAADAARELEARLRKAITEKIDGPLNDLRAGIKGFDHIEQELTERLNIGERALAIKPSSPSFKLRM